MSTIHISVIITCTTPTPFVYNVTWRKICRYWSNKDEVNKACLHACCQVKKYLEFYNVLQLYKKAKIYFLQLVKRTITFRLAARTRLHKALIKTKYDVLLITPWLINCRCWYSILSVFGATWWVSIGIAYSLHLLLFLVHTGYIIQLENRLINSTII